MKRVLIVLALTMSLTLVATAPVGAITNGELDGEDHPQVVLLVMDLKGGGGYRCSGTLLSPTVLLTAGHCASNYPDPDYAGMRVFTESDVDNGDNNYPLAGPNSVEAVDWAAHPLYETAPFWLHDVGVVILEEPGVVLPPSKYGKLPEAGELDSYKTKRGKSKLWFTAVGYGLQKSFPSKAAWKNQADRVRMVAYPKLIQINNGYVGDYSLLLSNNAKTGGTCFGDSGGPNFIKKDNVVGGITSFGKNGNCKGTGGVFRTDRQNVLDFVNGFLD